MKNKTLSEIQEMWKKDCQIDDIELDASSLKVPQLHAKYAEILSSKKLIQIQFLSPRDLYQIICHKNLRRFRVLTSKIVWTKGQFL